MKLCLALIALCFSTVASADCKQMQNLRLEMNLTASNIANVNTTRTPQGGAYKMKELVNSEIVERKQYIEKYNPDHIDAKEYGYVTYPDIDLYREMSKMLELTREYEKIYSPKCPSTYLISIL
jgi:flagellar basal body rod protein FlgC